MRISVIVPTFRRVTFLRMVVDGLRAQLRPSDEVIFGVREDDEDTLVYLERLESSLSITVVKVAVPGVVASMQRALDRSTGDIVGLLDDDAVPEPDWLERIEQAFQNDPELAGIGGRDLLQDHPEMRRSEPTTDRVGILTWYGRVYGNHHRGEKKLLSVDVLKGCNCAFRGDWLRQTGFEHRLRGEGAQVHWELALCLRMRPFGRLAYDPGIRVVHHVAPRHGSDQSHRGKAEVPAVSDMVFNEVLVIQKYAGWLVRWTHPVFALTVGGAKHPGLVRFLITGFRRWELFKANLRGVITALKMTRRSN